MSDTTGSSSPDPQRPHADGPGVSPQAQFAAISGVSRTLLTPLLARHLASSRTEPLITDPVAGALLAELGMAHLTHDWSFRAVEVGTAVRTELIDTAIRELAHGHSSATVITLGAGLCTRCVRLADLDLTWIDVDLAPVAALRATLLPPPPNRTVIADSVLATGWRDTLATGPPTKRIFILKGLTMYLHEPELRALVADLATRFPGSDLLIETVGPRTDPPGRYQHLRDRHTIGIQFSWGIRRHEQLTQWHPRLELVRTWYVMDHHRRQWPLLIRALRYLPSVRCQSKIGHFHIATTARNRGPSLFKCPALRDTAGRAASAVALQSPVHVSPRQPIKGNISAQPRSTR
jgi:O-methyltransferase involved in polyketide biosynthesis